MPEHCTECRGTGKAPNSNLACLHCSGIGIEPNVAKRRSIGPFHAYPKLKRDLIITIGLIVLLLILNGSSIIGG